MQPSLCCHCTDTHAAAAVSAVRSQSSYTLYTAAEKCDVVSTTHGLLGGVLRVLTGLLTGFPWQVRNLEEGLAVSFNFVDEVCARVGVCI